MAFVTHTAHGDLGV
ncbi:hypothetical protein D031_4590A, partial [Vibrio parahaemolyticus VP-48]